MSKTISKVGNIVLKGDATQKLAELVPREPTYIFVLTHLSQWDYEGDFNSNERTLGFFNSVEEALDELYLEFPEVESWEVEVNNLGDFYLPNPTNTDYEECVWDFQSESYRIEKKQMNTILK